MICLTASLICYQAAQFTFNFGKFSGKMENSIMGKHFHFGYLLSHFKSVSNGLLIFIMVF